MSEDGKLFSAVPVSAFYDDLGPCKIDRIRTAEKLSIAIGTFLSITTVVTLGIIDRRRLSVVINEMGLSDAVILRLSQYTEKPPTTVFISFVIMLMGVNSTSLTPGNCLVPLCMYIDVLVTCGQCLYVTKLVSFLIEELALEDNHTWLVIAIFSTVLNSFLFPVYCKGDSKFVYMRSFQFWVTILGCLLEICRYSTSNLTNYITYFGSLTTNNTCRRLILTLIYVHVCSLVSLGFVLLAIGISFSIADESADEIDPSDNYSSWYEIAEERPWISILFVPFLVVSLYHCYQLKWIQFVVDAS